MTTPTPVWHSLAVADAIEALGTTPDGLGADEAARRLAVYGPNRLAPPKPASALAILTAQFRSVVIGLLIVAGALSLLLGDLVETVAIAAVIALNAGIGFGVELRARRAMEGLLKLGAARAHVIRGGRHETIDAAMLVPGDIIELNAGQTVPADVRITVESDLRTNEAALTGESLPVSKRIEPVEAETPLADRRNMAYQGTTIAAGTARALVVATGNATEVGRIGALAQGMPDERTPLERRLDALGHRLVLLALAVAVLVAVLGLVQGAPWALMIETAIAVAVAAVPEGLPAVATITLAVGLRRMARRNALVRRLPTVEALGSTTVVCTDKTRTLTSGDMTIVRVWSARGDVLLRPDEPPEAVDAGAREILRTAAHASRPQHETADADPVDRAVLRAAEAAGADGPGEGPAALIPFSSDRKFMAVFERRHEDLTAFVKGAPGVIVARSTAIETGRGVEPLDEATRVQLLDINRRLAARGLRVLGVARASVLTATEDALHALTFCGFLGLIDPPAPGVKASIARLKTAGLRTVMLTGDQRLTAEAIGRELGLLDEGAEAIDSRELHGLDAAALAARLPRTSTFSRITPEDKLTIVRALQATGEIVAMLGDGVNDAPALRRADVGVAMGIRGTDVARDAASIVLQDDRFETIVAAVEEGRVIFDNIRKFVFYLFSCNLAEVLTLLAAGVAGLPLPLQPLQILWLNLLTDTLPALALALEPGDADVMERPPRDPQEAILSRAFMGQVLFYGALITAATLAAFLWALASRPEAATTVAFMTLALAQIFHLGTARSRRAVLRFRAMTANLYALGAVAVSILLQLAALYVEPLALTLDVVRLDLPSWAVVIGCAAAPAIVGQVLHSRAAGAP